MRTSECTFEMFVPSSMTLEEEIAHEIQALTPVYDTIYTPHSQDVLPRFGLAPQEFCELYDEQAWEDLYFLGFTYPEDEMFVEPVILEVREDLEEQLWWGVMQDVCTMVRRDESGEAVALVAYTSDGSMGCIVPLESAAVA